MKKRFTLAERICGSAPCELQTGERRAAAARSAENRLNPSPLTPLPRLEIPLRSRLSSLRCRCRDFGSRLPACLPSGILQGERGNKAFTLAEVLITLVIIGVIGALTVPALIQNTQKKEYVTALKKAYSTLSQAAQLIIAEEGSPKGDDSWLDSTEHAYPAFKKYLNNVKECAKGVKGCHAQGEYTRMDGLTAWGDTGKSLITADGMQFLFGFADKTCSSSHYMASSENNYCSDIIVDVNGEKMPNKVGRDVFLFLLKEDGIKPFGCSLNLSDCSKAAAGYGCTCKVISEGAMNY